MKLTFLLLALITPNAHTKQTPEPFITEAISAILSINKGKIINSSSVECSNGLIGDAGRIKKTSSPLFLKCAVDLCGPLNRDASAWITNSNYSTNIPPSILKKIEKLTPDMDRLFTKTLNDKKTLLKKIQQLTKNKSFNFDKLSPELKTSLDEAVFAPYVSKRVNKNAPLEKRLEVSLKLPPNASPGFIKALKNYSANLSESIMTDENSIAFQQAYDPKELASLARINLNKLKKKFQTNQSIISADKKENVKDIERILENPSKTDIGLVFTRLIYADEDSSEDSGLPRSFKRAICDISECQTAYSMFLKSSSLNESIHAYEQFLNSNTTKTHAINKCKAILTSSELMSSDLKKSQKVALLAKKRITQNVLPRFSKHSREMLLKYMNTKLDFTNKHLQKSDSKLSSYFKDNVANLIAKKKSVDEDDLWQQVIALNNSGIDLTLADDMAACGGSRNIRAWDTFFPMKELKQSTSDPIAKKILSKLSDNDLISISDFSCAHTDHGVHATSHEISHALNHFFATSSKLSSESAATYRAIRKCASENYPFAQDSTLFDAIPGDKVSTEEDTADLFAMIADGNDKKIYSCAYLEPDYENESYTNLTLVNPEKHSSELTRALFEAINKNIPFPDSCKKLIVEERPEVRFKKCI